MAGVAAVGYAGGGTQSVQLQAEYQARVLAKQIQVVRDVGTAALSLIQAATSFDPQVGQNLDVLA